ncbi:hypothetical protein L1887_17744 [Cichorium endivia]|nr:hypothetical protein L1887_17744 [Cichorium endivia]
MKKGTKRKAAAASRKDDTAPTSTEPAATATATTTTEEPKQQHKKEPTKVGRPIKRSKVSKPEPEPEFFDDQREFEDLWKQVFLVGTEWDQLDLLSKYKWNFSNLERDFNRGTKLFVLLLMNFVTNRRLFLQPSNPRFLILVVAVSHLRQEGPDAAEQPLVAVGENPMIKYKDQSRFLHLVLYTAERAWSHAMEKRQLPDGPNARQRSYLIGRLRKAVKWATLFAELCSIKGDSRTSLEAKAYASYMKGNLLFEQDHNWDIALKSFKSARQVISSYTVIPCYFLLLYIYNQVLCCERVEELEPSIRYCLHKIGESNLQASELVHIREIEGPGLDLFKAKLEDDCEHLMYIAKPHMKDSK